MEESMLPYISPEETWRKLQAGEIRLVDIRDVQEFAEVAIPGSLLAPLPVTALQPLKDADAPEKPVVFTCRSGRRTENAAARLQGLVQEGYQLRGGIMAWEKAGLPVVRTAKLPMPINRQIQICAGALVLVGVVGSTSWSPLLWLAGFVGAGLFFAGVSGFCGLGILLSHAPWNKVG